MRFEDWQSRLVEYLSGVSRAEFAYGTHDCALFCAGAVEAMTGVDLAVNWRGQYKTMAQGLRVLNADGYRDHVDLAARHFEEIPIFAATLGDLAVMPTAEGLALGVVQGEGVYVLSQDRLGVMSIDQALRAYRVV
jgi:hypothetical protein